MTAEVLIVEGEAKSRQVLEVNLGKAGLSVATAETGAAALQRLAAEDPSVIVCNTGLPDMEGLELCKQTKAGRSASHFIFLSDDHSPEMREAALAAGADDFITKPVFIGELLARIRSSLASRSDAELEPAAQPLAFTGEISQLGVLNVIKTMELGCKSGVCRFQSPDGREATLYLRDGQIIDAELDCYQGRPAVQRLLQWNDGNFTIDFVSVDREPTIAESTRTTITEGMAQLEALTELRNKLGDLGVAVLQVDYERVGDALADLPVEARQVVQLFDGMRSVQDVVDDCDLEPAETQEVLFVLLQSKVLFDARLADVSGDGQAAVAGEITSSAKVSSLSSVPSASDEGDDSVTVDWGQAAESERMKEYESQEEVVRPKQEGSLHLLPPPRPGAARLRRPSLSPAVWGAVALLVAMLAGVAALQAATLFGRPVVALFAINEAASSSMVVEILQRGTARADLLLQGLLLLVAVVGLIRRRAYGYACAIAQLGVSLYWPLARLMQQVALLRSGVSEGLVPAAVAIEVLYLMVAGTVAIVLYRKRRLFH